MTILGRFLRRLGEKLDGTFYEGPEPPERLRAVVEEFAKEPRDAEEWKEFAGGFAEEVYRAAWTRGYEKTLREYDWRPEIPPEELADMVDPGWRDDGRGIVLTENVAAVPGEKETEEERDRRIADEVFLAGARRG